ncbi:hypothetical protein [Taibaiella chishuiensis]|uniref:Uncharacterized protein n=1 Tax=Taibaiella chishuiensis TaxID=1434707 RepID=A0A2P8D7A2_9BACT|nr:hypothetical protein [Taibaiella chishuiensis]PSK93116.1 hypothetical protein B0I18_10285 [Taibaiella chishuiensis]
MLHKNELLDYITRWSAPYSPIFPLELEEKDLEMKTLAQRMTPDDFKVFIDTMNELTIDSDEHFNFMAFAFYYIQTNADTLYTELTSLLKENGPQNIIDLISFTKKPEGYTDLVQRVHYNRLDRETKFSFIDAFDILKSIGAIPFLNDLKQQETDDELLQEIDLVIGNLNRQR